MDLPSLSDVMEQNQRHLNDDKNTLTLFTFWYLQAKNFFLLQAGQVIKIKIFFIRLFI